ncbi:hypothetical protein H5410_023185, partial [Solanum commersonii]
EISWNDLSNAAEFAQFRVRMSELFHLEVGLSEKGKFNSNFEGGFERREKKRRKEKNVQDSSRSSSLACGFHQG